jgi:hypothetical protein
MTSQLDIFRIETLKRKKYQTPLLFSTDDQQQIDDFEFRKYSKSDESVVTPSASQSSHADSEISLVSVHHTYKSVVEDNRSIKRIWEQVRLTDLEEDMKKNEDHFRATSYFHAVFINYIR